MKSSLKNRSQLMVESLGERLCLSATLGLEKPVEPPPSAAVCHGVTVLAYARVDGVSPLNTNLADDYFSASAGRTSGPVFVGGWGSSMYQYSI